MAYLTRLMPNLRSHRVRTALRNAYEMHRDLMSAFPDAGPATAGRSHFRVLYRLDIAPDRATGLCRPGVLVQSQSDAPPNWCDLPQDDNAQPWTSLLPEMKRFEPRHDWFHADQTLRFRVRANPTRRLRRESTGLNGNTVDPRSVGKRVEIRETQRQIQWLARQGSRHGFGLVEVQAKPDQGIAVFDVCDMPEGKAIAHKPCENHGGITITHAAVTFEGLLRITDPRVFCDALLKGIGPAKAFGFGLLSVAPVR